MRTFRNDMNARSTPDDREPVLVPTPREDRDAYEDQLDWLARKELLERLKREREDKESKADWPGWGRTTVSGSKVQRPAIRRRASASDEGLVRSNLSGGVIWIKAQGPVC